MAKKKFKIKLKSFRTFLESHTHSDSYVRVHVNTGTFDTGEVSIKLADCNRHIDWYFGVPGDPRAVAKITAVKKLVDKVYEFLTQEVE